MPFNFDAGKARGGTGRCAGISLGVVTSLSCSVDINPSQMKFVALGAWTLTRARKDPRARSLAQSTSHAWSAPRATHVARAPPSAAGARQRRGRASSPPPGGAAPVARAPPRPPAPRAGRRPLPEAARPPLGRAVGNSDRWGNSDRPRWQVLERVVLRAAQQFGRAERTASGHGHYEAPRPEDHVEGRADAPRGRGVLQGRDRAARHRQVLRERFAAARRRPRAEAAAGARGRRRTPSAVARVPPGRRPGPSEPGAHRRRVPRRHLQVRVGRHEAGRGLRQVRREADGTEGPRARPEDGQRRLAPAPAEAAGSCRRARAPPRGRAAPPGGRREQDARRHSGHGGRRRRRHEPPTAERARARPLQGSRRGREQPVEEEAPGGGRVRV